MVKFIKPLIILLICCALAWFGIRYFFSYKHEIAVLQQMITRLEADSRVAEVLVTGVNYNEDEEKMYTTIKFLEYDSLGVPLKPRYFTFAGNIIQFQSLVIRFEDLKVKHGDELQGKSIYLFWKVFMLDGANTKEFDITPVNQIPAGYKLPDQVETYESQLWKKFWSYALDPTIAKKDGVKNAQIEAPGTVFIPGILYTIRIEHDGGLRIDSSPISPILKGEFVPN